MRLRRPLAVVTPTLDGDVLQVLAGVDASFTPPHVQALIGRHSVEGVRKVLVRLQREGIVRAVRVGHAFTYELNRDHLAAPYITALADLRAEVLRRLGELLSSWTVPCEYAALFGSAAAGTMREDSDIDLFVVRPARTEPDDDRWRAQLSHLIRTVTAWTGNDTRILELSAREVRAGLASPAETVLIDIREQGIALHGPATYLNAPISARR